MKIPRDINYKELVKALKIYGYKVTRQTGGHLRLTTKINGEHHLTIPAHRGIKVKTLNNILLDVCRHFKKSKEEIVKELFG